jgi:vacuole morphology and inheritance protein 14
MLILT